MPKELDDAARVEGASALQVLLKVYVPLARPIYLAYGLVSVSYHWNNFLWPLIVTNSVETRPLTVGLQVFSSTDQGIDWSIIMRGDADDLGAAAGRLPAVPAPVRAELHARRHPLTSSTRSCDEARHLEHPVGPAAATAASTRAHRRRCARAFADFDVLCLQEVAANFPTLAGSARRGPVRALAALLPGFTPVEGVAVDIAGPDGRRRRFGNMILSPLPGGRSCACTCRGRPTTTAQHAAAAVEAVSRRRSGRCGS